MFPAKKPPFTCPHCGVAFADNLNDPQPLMRMESPFLKDLAYSMTDENLTLVYRSRECPSCGRIILYVGWAELKEKMQEKYIENIYAQKIKKEMMIIPKGQVRMQLADKVPSQIAKDYREACLVLSESPNASAALSRRCLQNILRTCAEVKPSDLNKEIAEILERNELPPYISTELDTVRQLGNFAAHPIQDIQSGEIIDVEPHEAEHLLAVLERLIDHYYVQPDLMRKRKNEINAKLKAAGKQPMK